MGSVLSSKEHKAIESRIQGFEPSSLATVIWDSINQVGVDDEQEKLGIHFEDIEPNEDSETGGSKVTFWDGDDAQQMPRKVFLEVMLLVGETTIKNYEDNYDLEKSIQLGTAVNRLKLAVVHLKKEIDTVQDQPSASAYRHRLDSGINMDEADNMVEELRARRGSWMWSSGEVDPSTFNASRRRSTKGIEGVLDRLPELRRRYSLSTEGSRSTTLGRVKNKLKVLSLLQKGSVVSPEAINEEHEDKDMQMLVSPPPAMGRHTSLPMYNLLSPQFVPTTQNTPLLPSVMTPTDELQTLSVTLETQREVATTPPPISTTNLQEDYRPLFQ